MRDLEPNELAWVDFSLAHEIPDRVNLGSPVP